MTLPINAIPKDTDREISAGRKKRWTQILFFTGIGGIVVGVCGLLISAMTLLHVIEKRSFADCIGVLLIIAAFPLIMFGAHALDKIRECEKAEIKKLNQQ